MEGEIFGLVGRRLGHSFSGRIHELLGCGGYRLIALEPEELEGFVRTAPIGGLNVTIPYKVRVMDWLDEIDPEARAIGSVNTVVPRGGRLVGYNTDCMGFEYMAARAGVDFSGRWVLVFGSGGASLTAVYAAKKLGAARVTVVSRRGEDNYDNLSRNYGAQILINATPLGMYPENGALPAEPSLFPRCEAVLDMVYNPLKTTLILRAEQLGLRCSGGLPMLVSQAAAAEELFFGRKTDPAETERIISVLRRDMGNIVLIGMPGSGKSAIGAALSQLTGRRLIDIDDEIVRLSGKSIAEIFAGGGETEFRALEREQTARFGAQGGVIIATGGGVVKDERNLAPLRQNGRIYHIERDISCLPPEGRPLSEHADLSAMYAQRAPMYERFRDARVDNSDTPQQAAERIWRDYNENSCH